MFILERLTSLVAPFSCLQCGNEGNLVCKSCLAAFCISLQPRCYRCLKPSQNFSVCKACSAKTPMGHVWIASRYSGLPEQLIHTFKFERAQAAALEIAYLMHQALPHLRPGTVIVPVPTVTSHIRQRGYDHTDLLARALSRESKHAYDPALRRLGQSRQVGAVRVQRLAQLRGAFRAAKPVAGKNILLVDDVVTTGATLEEAAWVLHRAGAKRINGLVFAQK